MKQKSANDSTNPSKSVVQSKINLKITVGQLNVIQHPFAGNGKKQIAHKQLTLKDPPGVSVDLISPVYKKIRNSVTGKKKISKITVDEKTDSKLPPTPIRSKLVKIHEVNVDIPTATLFCKDSPVEVIRQSGQCKRKVSNIPVDDTDDSKLPANNNRPKLVKSHKDNVDINPATLFDSDSPVEEIMEEPFKKENIWYKYHPKTSGKSRRSRIKEKHEKERMKQRTIPRNNKEASPKKASSQTFLEIMKDEDEYYANVKKFAENYVMKNNMKRVTCNDLSDKEIRHDRYPQYNTISPALADSQFNRLMELNEECQMNNLERSTDSNKYQSDLSSVDSPEYELFLNNLKSRV
jgi:hypothetical protein